MPTQHTGNVIGALSRHLGVAAAEISLSHDLYRDWGLTPLSLVLVLLDLERSAAIELPCEQFSDVRTVADLRRRFRLFARAERQLSDVRKLEPLRCSQSERRLRRELHHLRWLEQNLKQRAIKATAGNDSARRARTTLASR